MYEDYMDSVRRAQNLVSSAELISTKDKRLSKTEKMELAELINKEKELTGANRDKIMKKLEKALKKKKRISAEGEKLTISKEEEEVKKERSASTPESMKVSQTKIQRILNNKFYGTTKERKADLKFRNNFKDFWGANGHEVQLKTADGIELKGSFLFKPFTDEESKQAGFKPPTGKTFIYASGSFGTWDKYGKSLIPSLLKEGHQVLVFDYRGFGENIDEEITIDGLKLDTEAAIQAAVDLGIKEEEITLYGYSLGAALVTDVASRHYVDLILDRPFTTSEAVAHDESMFGIKKLAKKITSKFINISTIDALKNFKGRNIYVVMGKEEVGSKNKYKKEFEKTLENLEVENKEIVEIPELSHLDEKVQSQVKEIFLNRLLA